jgi:hypothetical protein
VRRDLLIPNFFLKTIYSIRKTLEVCKPYQNKFYGPATQRELMRLPFPEKPANSVKFTLKIWE